MTSIKRHTLAAASLCAAIPAMAQTGDSVTLYGIIDTAVRTQSGLTAAYARSPLNSSVVASGVGPTSRWGLRGSEDLEPVHGLNGAAQASSRDGMQGAVRRP